MHMKKYLLNTFFIASKELEAAMVSLINFSSILLHMNLQLSKCLSFALRSALAWRNSSFTADAIRESEREKKKLTRMCSRTEVLLFLHLFILLDDPISLKKSKRVALKAFLHTFCLMLKAFSTTRYSVRILHLKNDRTRTFLNIQLSRF